jgi:hypothetical protein
MEICEDPAPRSCRSSCEQPQCRSQRPSNPNHRACRLGGDTSGVAVKIAARVRGARAPTFLPFTQQLRKHPICGVAATLWVLRHCSRRAIRMHCVHDRAGGGLCGEGRRALRGTAKAPEPPHDDRASRGGGGDDPCTLHTHTLPRGTAPTAPCRCVVGAVHGGGQCVRWCGGGETRWMRVSTPGPPQTDACARQLLTAVAVVLCAVVKVR